ncbi:hypothetical protein AVEN_192853-1 [Araneus ventricosus]|uniref:Uncharacterized protein n=1 Tax=Araneus ventricosus TaxID=182803 RepID=A0A4Y2T513_ARAVE|nr:hypothetical protein AVEN_192853-1 [Araneus ventricosus]
MKVHAREQRTTSSALWAKRANHVVRFPASVLLGGSTLSPARLQLDCSENEDEEAVEQWVNEDSTLECCKVLSDDYIVSHATCGSEETRNFEECSESDEDNLGTHQKLRHGHWYTLRRCLITWSRKMRAHLQKK